MAQIVINIDNKTYKVFMELMAGNLWRSNYKGIIEKCLDAIKHGKVLPKGHGRLIDAEAFQKSYCESNCGNRKCVDAMDECIFIGDLQLAPTIIEADKEERK